MWMRRGESEHRAHWRTLEKRSFVFETARPIRRAPVVQFGNAFPFSNGVGKSQGVGKGSWRLLWTKGHVLDGCFLEVAKSDFGAGSKVAAFLSIVASCAGRSSLQLVLRRIYTNSAPLRSMCFLTGTACKEDVRGPGRLGRHKEVKAE